MKRRLTLSTLIAAATLCAACSPALVQTDPLWRDVARKPPAPAPETLNAIAADAPFAGWVIYMGRACEAFGCPQ